MNIIEKFAKESIQRNIEYGIDDYKDSLNKIKEKIYDFDDTLDKIKFLSLNIYSFVFVSLSSVSELS